MPQVCKARVQISLDNHDPTNLCDFISDSVGLLVQSTVEKLQSRRSSCSRNLDQSTVQFIPSISISKLRTSKVLRPSQLKALPWDHVLASSFKDSSIYIKVSFDSFQAFSEDSAIRSRMCEPAAIAVGGYVPIGPRHVRTG